nr:helix-turn-helix domain-containing protein [Thermoactinospora rubra]
MPPGTPDLLTVGEVARIFRVSPKTVSHWAKTGRLRCLRTLGGHARFPREVVETFLARTDPASARRT